MYAMYQLEQDHSRSRSRSGKAEDPVSVLAVSSSPDYDLGRRILVTRSRTFKLKDSAKRNSHWVMETEPETSATASHKGRQGTFDSNRRDGGRHVLKSASHAPPITRCSVT